MLLAECQKLGEDQQSGLSRGADPGPDYSGHAILQGRQETGKEQSSLKLCSPFPLPDQHWSDNIPSDAETEFHRQHLEVVEAELELKVSENLEEQPPVTLQDNKRGQSAVTGEAIPRIPTKSHVRTSGTKGTGHEAE